jgi:hypothetical protein
VFYEAARYACRFRRNSDAPTLAERIRSKLVSIAGSDDPEKLVSLVEAEQSKLSGRTLGPPVQEFLELLCAGNAQPLSQYVDSVTPTKRTRSGAIYLATLLVMIRAAGVPHVLLCCDQLEDFASSTTSRQKRTLETERFRDYILELQPMCDMLSCVVTMHPRATQAIGTEWRLADLPSYDHDREENRHRIVILQALQSLEQVRDLLSKYLTEYRTEDPPSKYPAYPFTQEAIEALHARSGGKPRDILRKASALVETGAEENWDLIDGKRAARVLDSLAMDDEDTFRTPSTANVPTRADLWNE